MICGLLKRGFYRFIEAITAKFIGILKLAHKILFQICKNSGSNLSSFIQTFFSTPIFQALILLFNFRYLLLKRKELLFTSKNTVDSLDKAFFQLNSGSCNLIEISNVLKRRYNFFRCLKTGKG